ncbi:aldehyde dehydrogenase family protein [Sutcliffiella cohnii]
MTTTGLKVLGSYIDGKWIVTNTENVISIKNPANGSVIALVNRGGAQEVDLAVVAAQRAFHSAEWQNMKPYDRGKLLYHIASIIRENKEELSQIETMNVGKPLKQARADVEIAARYFEYYGGVADKVYGESIPIEPGIVDFTVREPLGVVGHIIPWNYPIQITARSIAVSLATGNAAILKPAEDTPLSALKLVELIEQVGIPNGIVNIVTGYGYEAGAALASHPDLNHITFTGSVETGKKVMESASKNIVPVTLELGGKSPNIVFNDCNQTDALQHILQSIVQNAGQTCSAGSRLVIEKNIKDEFVEKLANAMQKLTIGPGLEDKDLGPILSEVQFKRINHYIELAKQEGFKFVAGGNRVMVNDCEEAYYMKPTIIDDVPASHPLAQEEIFGPVLTVTTFETEEEAVSIANGTPFGLVAGIWTENVKRAHRIANQLQCGQVFINHYGAGGGIAMPFGGYKKSGFGREKGLETLRHYTQVKNIALKY